MRLVIFASAWLLAGPIAPLRSEQRARAEITSQQARRKAPTPQVSYRPVDIGQHVTRGGTKRKQISEALFHKLFERSPKGRLTTHGQQFFENKRRRQQAAAAPGAVKSRRGDRSYRRLRGPWAVRVREMSTSQVRIWVLWKTGASRWHHYYDLVADYLLFRSKHVDDVLALKKLYARYSFRFKGLGHGVTANDLVAELRSGFGEYPGQSPSFRNVYYPHHDLHVVIQDGVVKYLERGRPGWWTAKMSAKPRVTRPSRASPSSDSFTAGLVIPKDYPMKPVVDLSFGYGDDPPKRQRCFLQLSAHKTGLVLCTGMQGGIFRVAARVKLKVPGTAYLRAIEPIRNTVLSAERLKAETRQFLKPSSSGAFVDYYTKDATIYEGGWNDWYPARFELWFEPADQGKPIKLVEDVYLINGWQR